MLPDLPEINYENLSNTLIQYSCPNWYALLRKQAYQLGRNSGFGSVFNRIFSKIWHKTYQLGHEHSIAYTLYKFLGKAIPLLKHNFFMYKWNGLLSRFFLFFQFFYWLIEWWNSSSNFYWLFISQQHIGRFQNRKTPT